jgi:alkylhydroperoxidase/carboxymuconolactone decarboxylase family protein YurZ
MQLPDETDKAFRGFYQSAHEPGVLGSETKILIHLAVAMALGCDP